MNGDRHSARNDAVLDDWQQGAPAKVVARRRDMSPGNVLAVVHKAREAGDRRAVRRRRPDARDIRQRREHAW